VPSVDGAEPEDEQVRGPQRRMPVAHVGLHGGERLIGGDAQQAEPTAQAWTIGQCR
jgi:hypothetical protein